MRTEIFNYLARNQGVGANLWLEEAENSTVVYANFSDQLPLGLFETNEKNTGMAVNGVTNASVDNIRELAANRDLYDTRYQERAKRAGRKAEEMFQALFIVE